MRHSDVLYEGHDRLDEHRVWPLEVQQRLDERGWREPYARMAASGRLDEQYWRPPPVMPPERSGWRGASIDDATAESGGAEVADFHLHVMSILLQKGPWRLPQRQAAAEALVRRVCFRWRHHDAACALMRLREHRRRAAIDQLGRQALVPHEPLRMRAVLERLYNDAVTAARDQTGPLGPQGRSGHSRPAHVCRTPQVARTAHAKPWQPTPVHARPHAGDRPAARGAAPPYAAPPRLRRAASHGAQVAHGRRPLEQRPWHTCELCRAAARLATRQGPEPVPQAARHPRARWRAAFAAAAASAAAVAAAETHSALESRQARRPLSSTQASGGGSCSCARAPCARPRPRARWRSASRSGGWPRRQRASERAHGS